MNTHFYLFDCPYPLILSFALVFFAISVMNQFDKKQMLETVATK